MIDALFNQTNYVATKRMMDATVLRHEAIAHNLANVETPHYQRIDIAPTFAQTLRQAASAKDVSQIQQLKPSLEIDVLAPPVGRDGNTVQLEQELLNLNQNTLAHALESQLVTGSLLKLRLAITGRPS